METFASGAPPDATADDDADDDDDDEEETTTTARRRRRNGRRGCARAFLHLGLAKLALLRHLDRRRRHVVRLAELRGRGGRGLGELPEERSHHTLAVIANTAAATGVLPYAPLPVLPPVKSSPDSMADERTDEAAAPTLSPCRDSAEAKVPASRAVSSDCATVRRCSRFFASPGASAPLPPPPSPLASGPERPDEDDDEKAAFAPIILDTLPELVLPLA